MAIYGNIEEAGLPDVLQLLALGRKTGCLSVVEGEVHGEIYLAGGRISYATVSGRSERFGEILVKNGLITRGQLQVAIEAQAHGPKRQLGRILVDSGQIDRADLDRFVRLQVEEAVYYLFARKHGEFTFSADKRTSHQFLAEPLDAEGLLLEGARRVDEWSLIQRKIPSFDLVYQRTKDTHSGAVAAELTDAQRRILPLLDGTRDVAGVVDTTGMAEFEVGKALYGLIMAGFAQLVERRVHVRHLEYRELLAWVVREAEFADPQRRKDAGRHIVDCPTCAERLRKIQVRRTEGSGALTAPVAGRVTPVETRPPAPLPEPAAPPMRPAAAAPPHPERRVHDRRLQDRRVGCDRRLAERRTGLDRRRAVNASWGLLHGERRRGPRREDERRVVQGGERRSRNGDQRAVEARASAPAARRPGPGARTTEPRLLQHRDLHDRDWPLRVDRAGGRDEEQLVRAPAAWQAGIPSSAVGSAVAPSGQPAGATGAVLEAGAALPAPAELPGTPSREIEWLVSPQESNQMLRASRPMRRPAAVAPGSPAGTAAAPTGDSHLAAPPPEPPQRWPTARHYPPSPAEVPAGVVTPGHLTWGGDDTPPRTGDEFLGLNIDWHAVPVRLLVVAAAITFVGFLGYGAGRVARGGRARQAVQTIVAEPGAAAARGPANEPRLRAPGGAAAQPGSEGPSQTRRPSASQQAVALAEAQPVRRQSEPAQRPSPAPATAAAPVPAAQPTAQVVEAPPAQPAPTVGVIRGVVHAPNGGGLAAARVSVRGTALSAVTDAAGAFEIRDVPDGAAVLQAVADGYVAGTADVRARAGATVAADLTLARAAAAAAAAEPDRELSEGGWGAVDRAEAISTLGGTLGAIEGLAIESIAKSTAGTRQRVRVAQLTPAGQRIVLTETRAGAAVRGVEGAAHVTALRIMPPSEAYPFSTGTASFGNILITAKSAVPPDALRSLLGRLSEVSP